MSNTVKITPPHGFDTNNFSTNQRVITLTGTYDASSSPFTLSYIHTYKDRFNIDRPAPSPLGTFTTGTNNQWALSNIVLVAGENIITVSGSIPGSTSAKVTITLTNSSQLGVIVDPPTGLEKDQYTDKVILRWLGNSKVSYVEENISFPPGSSVTDDSIYVVNGYGVSVSGGVHTPNAPLFGSNQVSAALTDVKFHKAKLTPVGSSPNTDTWLLPTGFTSTDGSGYGRPVSDVSPTAGQVALFNAPGNTSIILATGNVIKLNQTISTGSSIYATFNYNELQEDTFTLTAQGASTTTGVTIVGQNSGRVPNVVIDLGSSSVSNSAWHIQKLWVNGVSDLKAKPGAKTETVTLDFTAPTTFTVTSSLPSSGTSGSGVVGRTFYHTGTGFKFTIDESGLYTSGDKVVFSVLAAGIFTVNSNPILNLPGLNVRLANIESVVPSDTVIVKTAKRPASTTPNAPYVREQLILTESGAVDSSTIRVTSADTTPLTRRVYQLGTHYTLINSEDVNYPTRIARLVLPPESQVDPIPLNSSLLVSYQVLQDVSIKGYNVYASFEPAGGTTGYIKLNKNLITDKFGIKDVVTSKETYREVQNGMRSTTTVERILRLNEYTFEASKALLTDPTVLGTRPTPDLTTYFVITAVAATNEPNRKTEVESVHSVEVVAKPIEITNQVQEFVPRTFDEIVEDYITSALSTQPILDVKPSSVSRDIHIDPVANEIEKVYFMLDFVNKSQSFLTLLAIDDPEGTGISASDTAYKAQLQLVFNFEDQATTQAFIDSQFDKLASNVSVTRRGAEFSRGQVTLSTLSKPSTVLSITPQSTFIATTANGAVRFKSLVSIVIQPELFESYFNAQTRRYEVDIPVIAEQAGESGNIDAGAISQSSVSNFTATNETPFLYGSDIESNRSLAERALIALMGVDFGTIGGYVKDVVSNAGVLKVTSQGAGDPFMFRDHDSVRGISIGGKVDLYVQGSRPLVYQEEFGLNYPRKKETINFTLNSPNTFYTSDPIPTTASLLSVKKTLNGNLQPFDLDKVIVSGKSVTLDSENSRNSGLLDNITGAKIEVEYYTTGNFLHSFEHRPVSALTSLVSSVTGTVGTGNYILSTEDDLFLYGGSTQSRPSIRIVPSTNVSFGIQAYTENITLQGSVPTPLSAYAVDISSLQVSNLTGGTYTLGNDYRIVVTGNQITKTQIARIVGGSSTISDGQEVVVAYNASETFLVQYQVENLIETIQESLETKEYATADVLVKKANEVPIDISAEVILQKGISQSEVDYRIRTALGRHFGSLRLGDSVYQSDIIRIIDSVPGVYAVDTPLLKLARANNSYVLGDLLSVTSIVADSLADKKSFKLLKGQNDNPLSHTTVTGGGILNGSQMRSVGLYIGSQYYKGISDSAQVQKTAYTCYIGPDKVTVSGLDDSLQERIKSKDIKVIANYFKYDTSGSPAVDDILVNTFEYPTLANLLFSYRERP